MTSYSDEEVKASIAGTERIHDTLYYCDEKVMWAASQYLKEKAITKIYKDPELDALGAQEALEIVMDGLEEAARKPLSRIDINAYTLWIAMRGLLVTIVFLKQQGKTNATS
jgi:hypothetical protein